MLWVALGGGERVGGRLRRHGVDGINNSGRVTRVMIREEVKAAREQEDLRRKCLFFCFFCSGSKRVMGVDGINM